MTKKTKEPLSRGLCPEKAYEMEDCRVTETG
jgi:hypothetical protein